MRSMGPNRPILKERPSSCWSLWGSIAVSSEGNGLMNGVVSSLMLADTQCVLSLRKEPISCGSLLVRKRLDEFERFVAGKRSHEIFPSHEKVAIKGPMGCERFVAGKTYLCCFPCGDKGSLRGLKRVFASVQPFIQRYVLSLYCGLPGPGA